MTEPPEYVSKRQFLMGGVVVGVVLGILVAAAIVGGHLLLDYRSNEIAHNTDRSEDAARTNRRQARLIHRLDVLTHPSPAQYRRQLREGIRRCLREPSCRRLFPALASRGRAHRQARRRGRTTSSTAPAASRPSPRQPAPASPSPPRRTRPPSRRPSTSSPAPTPPQGGGNPGGDRPIIAVTVPVVPAHVCTPTVAINC